MKSIFIIEDDPRIVDFLTRGLAGEGYRIETARDGMSGLEGALAGMHELIILDVLLPLKDGRDVCRELRAKGVRTPILMLTALDSTDDIVRGLRFGADDYLTKPFSFSVLVARVEALLRRGGEFDLKPAILRVGDLVFNRDALTVQRAGNNIELTSTEFALLELFMTSEGKLLTRAHILDNVWGVSEDPLTNIVDVYVARLRAKVDHGYDVKLLKTIRGRGYRMDVTAG